MSPQKDETALSRDISSRFPVRRASQSRVRRAEEVPSSIPPAPHPLESDLVGLDWWLDAHMNFASNLLCLEQSAETSGEQGMVSVGVFLRPLGDLRDALYELYCDASDRRMRPLVEAEGPVGTYVCALYAACDGVLEALMTIASEIHRGRPDLEGAMSDIGAQCKAFAASSSILPEHAMHALEAVEVDATNPVDPLRSARRDLRDAIEAAQALMVAGAAYGA